MPEETLPKATSAPESSKGGTLVLVIAILAFITAVVAIVMNIVMKPDTSAIEARVQAIQTSVQANTAEITALKDAQSVVDKQMKEVAEMNSQDMPIVEATDYKYDRATGNLISVKDGRVIYSFEKERRAIQEDQTWTDDDLAVYLFGLQGSKLIIWQIGTENSPGPGWDYEIWQTDKLKYIDLNNPSEGPQPYTVPEWKKQEAKEQLDELERLWE